MLYQNTLHEVTLKVFNVIKELLPNNITIETKSTLQDLPLDSLDTIEILMNLEQEFDIEIPDAEAKTLITVEDVINLVMKKISK